MGKTFLATAVAHRGQSVLGGRLFGIALAVAVALSTTFFLPSRGYAINFYTDEATWAAAVQSFGQVAPVNIATQVPNFATLPAGTPLLLPFNEGLKFDTLLTGLQVPTGWNNWSAGYAPEFATPRVLYSGPDSFTGTFTPPGDSVIAFGLSAEANLYSTATITLTTTDGGTHSLSQTVTTPNGAKFFGWIGGDVTSIQMTCSTGAGCFGFAIAELVKGDFAGTHGAPNCHGKSISALAQAYGGIDAAAAALGYSSVDALQNAVKAFCGN